MIEPFRQASLVKEVLTRESGNHIANKEIIETDGTALLFAIFTIDERIIELISDGQDLSSNTFSNALHTRIAEAFEAASKTGREINDDNDDEMYANDKTALGWRIIVLIVVSHEEEDHHPDNKKCSADGDKCVDDVNAECISCSGALEPVQEECDGDGDGVAEDGDDAPEEPGTCALVGRDQNGDSADLSGGDGHEEGHGEVRHASIRRHWHRLEHEHQLLIHVAML